MTPEKFLALWRDNPLTERASAQGHFDNLCELIGVDSWADYTPAMPDEEILCRLLALNLARKSAEGGA